MSQSGNGVVPLPLSDAHYAAIGKVASNWAALERLMDSLIWRVALVMDNEGACITSQFPSMGRRLNALIALVRLQGGSQNLIDRYNEFNRDSFGLGERRNRVVHDPWLHDAATGTPHRLQITADKRLVLEYRPVSTSDVEKLADDIWAFVNRFDDLARDTKAELDALRRTRLEKYLESLPAEPSQSQEKPGS